MAAVLCEKCFLREILRKILVSVKFMSAILGPEMAAPILWTPGENAFFCRKTSMSIKFLVLGGGGEFWFGGGGSADFIFMGAGILLKYPLGCSSMCWLFWFSGPGLSCTRLRVPPVALHVSRYTCRSWFPGFYRVLQVWHRCRATPPKNLGVAPPPPVPGGVAPKFGSEKVSRYTGVSQLQLRVSRYIVQLRSWVLPLPRLPPWSRSLRLFPWASILLYGPVDIAWICCPQLPHHPCKNGTSSK